jgi:osmotically-inducible protein OsmY
MTAPYPSHSLAGPQAAPSGIQRAAQRLLQSSSYAAIRHVCCEFERGELRLYGNLPTHYLKQVALAIVAGLEGVLRVKNQIQVGPAVPPATAGPPGSAEDAVASREPQ